MSLSGPQTCTYIFITGGWTIVGTASKQMAPSQASGISMRDGECDCPEEAGTGQTDLRHFQSLNWTTKCPKALDDQLFYSAFIMFFRMFRKDDLPNVSVMVHN